MENFGCGQNFRPRKSNFFIAGVSSMAEKLMIFTSVGACGVGPGTKKDRHVDAVVAVVVVDHSEVVDFVLLGNVMMEWRFSLSEYDFCYCCCCCSCCSCCDCCY